MSSRPEIFHEDLELRRRLLAREPGAVAEVTGSRLDALYEFVHYRTGSDRHMTEEIVQETLLIACDPKSEYDGRSRLSTWLCGIARHKVMEARRKRRPQPLQDLLIDTDPEIDAILSGIDRIEVPEEILARQETADLVGATLSSLPPEYREALVAKYIDDRTAADMAREAGSGVKGMESRLYRARLAFGRVFTLLAGKRGEALS